MITLYNFAGGARGVRVAWQCEEMGLAYRTVVFGFPPPADYLTRHPAGTVPFLEDDADGVAMSESVAMMLYLADRYGPTPLLPQASALRARVLELTVASEAAMGGPMNPLIATRFAAPADRKESWTADFAAARISDALARAEALAASGEYLVGDGLTLADIAIATALSIWQGALDKPIPPRLTAHRERMMARPAYQRAKAAFAG